MSRGTWPVGRGLAWFDPFPYRTPSNVVIDWTGCRSSLCRWLGRGRFVRELDAKAVTADLHGDRGILKIDPDVVSGWSGGGNVVNSEQLSSISAIKAKHRDPFARPGRIERIGGRASSQEP